LLRSCTNNVLAVQLWCWHGTDGRERVCMQHTGQDAAGLVKAEMQDCTYLQPLLQKCMTGAEAASDK
jgi:hypothetical protein